MFQGNEGVRAIFVTSPENAYYEPGSYYKARKHVQKEDVLPKVALEELSEKYKAIASDLNLDEASAALESFVYPQGIFEKMPPQVSAMHGELECELQVELEEDIEAELEELELNSQAEEWQVKGKGDLFYPPRMQSTQKTSLDQIHKAYDSELFISEAFLPVERNKTLSPFKRTAFESSMFNIGEILIKTKQGKIEEAVIEDPLRDSEMLRGKDFIYDIRTGKISGFSVLSNWALDPDQLLKSRKFNRLMAQAKFLDGRISGYQRRELEELKKWLQESGPEEMQRHFKNEILRFRYRDKRLFEKAQSQLGDLFKELL